MSEKPEAVEFWAAVPTSWMSDNEYPRIIYGFSTEEELHNAYDEPDEESDITTAKFVGKLLNPRSEVGARENRYMASGVVGQVGRERTLPEEQELEVAAEEAQRTWKPTMWNPRADGTEKSKMLTKIMKGDGFKEVSPAVPDLDEESKSVLDDVMRRM